MKRAIRLLAAFLFLLGATSCSTQRSMDLSNGNYDHNTGTYKTTFKAGKEHKVSQEIIQNNEENCNNDSSQTASNSPEVEVNKEAPIMEKIRIDGGSDNLELNDRNHSKIESYQKMNLRETYKMLRVISKYKRKAAPMPSERVEKRYGPNIAAILSIIFGGLAYLAAILAIAAIISASTVNPQVYMLWALGVTSAIVAIVTGIIGIKQSSESDKGRGPAIAGTILGGIFLILSIIIGVYALLIIYLINSTRH